MKNKRLIAVLLSSAVLLTGCSSQSQSETSTSAVSDSGNSSVASSPEQSETSTPSDTGTVASDTGTTAQSEESTSAEPVEKPPIELSNGVSIDDVSLDAAPLYRNGQSWMSDIMYFLGRKDVRFEGNYVTRVIACAKVAVAATAAAASYSLVPYYASGEFADEQTTYDYSLWDVTGDKFLKDDTLTTIQTRSTTEDFLTLQINDDKEDHKCTFERSVAVGEKYRYCFDCSFDFTQEEYDYFEETVKRYLKRFNTDLAGNTFGDFLMTGVGDIRKDDVPVGIVMNEYATAWFIAHASSEWAQSMSLNAGHWQSYYYFDSAASKMYMHVVSSECSCDTPEGGTASECKLNTAFMNTDKDVAENIISYLYSEGFDTETEAVKAAQASMNEAQKALYDKYKLTQFAHDVSKDDANNIEMCVDKYQLLDDSISNLTPSLLTRGTVGELSRFMTKERYDSYIEMTLQDGIIKNIESFLMQRANDRMVRYIVLPQEIIPSITSRTEPCVKILCCDADKSTLTLYTFYAPVGYDYKELFLYAFEKCRDNGIPKLDTPDRWVAFACPNAN